MEVNIKQAAKLFFSNASLEMLFIEAIANALDANASKISIKISMTEFNNPDSLKITINDNGVGFTNERFNKFCKLLEVENEDHKGMGRLIYLNYFNNVIINSSYGFCNRRFTFNESFKGNNDISKLEKEAQQTSLTFSGYNKSKIASYDYIRPSILKQNILNTFYPRLYILNKRNVPVKINISLEVESPNIKKNFVNSNAEIDSENLELLKEVPVESDFLGLLTDSKILYSIKKTPSLSNNFLITAVCVDDRTYHLDLISTENIPKGYEIIFLFQSNSFIGKVDPSRQKLNFDDSSFKTLKSIFIQNISFILKKELPQISKNQQKVSDSLNSKYPHLLGLFNIDKVGLISREETLKQAQEVFFKMQRSVLDANNYSDDIFEKTLELSSRTLTEYVLYRQHIIDKLEHYTKNDSEADLHKLIMPMKKQLHQNNFINDLYNNNAWLLDDKYMSFSTIYSDLKMTDILKEITSDETIVDETRPDIVLIFSDDPNSTKKIDVVIVELKKKGLKLAKNEEVISQLKQRARKLCKYYPDKIQRIWFYGITEIDDEFKLSLIESDYQELYSSDSVFYKEEKILIDLQGDKIPIGVYILSIEAFIEDAKKRNSTFLKILKNEFVSPQENKYITYSDLAKIETISNS